VARDLKWFDPALALVAQSIIPITSRVRVRQRQGSSPQFAVQPWILLALSAGHSVVDGCVAHLTMRRVSNGSGYLHPDVFHCGLLRTNREFQESLQNAWYAELYPHLGD